MPFTFKDKVVLRSPRFSFEDFFRNDPVSELFNDQNFREALYVASPDLHNFLLNPGNREVTAASLSLFKYFSRSCFRTTPFGLFAGISMVKFGDRDEMIFEQEKRCTRLDAEYVCALTKSMELLPAITRQLIFFPNNSIYQIGDKLRYIEFHTEGEKRFYNLSQVKRQKEIETVLRAAQQGQPLSFLKKKLTEYGMSGKEADEFLRSMIENQLLVSALEPSVTGKEFFVHLIDSLNKIRLPEQLDGVKRSLITIANSIKELDSRKANGSRGYEHVLRMLDDLKVPYVKKKVFQVDMVKTIEKGVLSNSIRKTLEKAVNILTRLAPEQRNPDLEKFIERFNERYEHRAMPLLEILDTENGIGYPDLIEDDKTSLTENIPLSTSTGRSFKLDAVRQWLFKRLQRALFNNEYAVNITDSELEEFNANEDSLPSSFSVMFRVTDFKRDEVFAEAIYGPTATRLLGRFAHLDKDIHELTCDIVSGEQKANPDVVFAEIVHLPENRIGNIALHPSFYDFEIPCLTRSSLPCEQQISMDDLEVSVQGGYVKLTSKRLNKEIIPRLSNAHNFHLSETPVYRFLCDLQAQHLNTHLTFSWGTLSREFLFLPRVTYDNIILHLATWQLPRNEWKFLINSGEDLDGNVDKFRRQWRLPRFVVLADADNELIVDFDNKLTIDCFLQEIKTKEIIVLKEFLFDNDTPVRDKAGKKYVSQFIASAVRTDEAYKTEDAKPAKSYKNQLVTKNFGPGSEWIYFKYYCGVRTADTVLIEFLKPLVSKLLKLKLIDTWFFIRYKDSHAHLRVRFHLRKQRDLAKVLELHSKQAEPFVKSGTIWKLQMDSYDREIERYGNASMKLSEQLFFHDSAAVLAFITKYANSGNDEIRWLWGIRSIHELLEDFQLSLERKIQLMAGLKDSFAREFTLPKQSRLEVDKKFRKYRAQIEWALSTDRSGNKQFRGIFDRSKFIRPVAGELLTLEKRQLLDVTIPELVRSYVHMSLNRLIPHTQRLHEMIIYDFMCRYYSSLKSRMNSAN